MGQAMYDRQFKEQIVKRILNKETTIGKMADQLDLHYTTIRNWVRVYKRDGQDAFPGKGNLKPEDEALRKLHKEIEDLKEENAILKKAAAYFAKNQK